MCSKNARDWAKLSIEAFERQTEYEAEGKTYTAKCAVCGKAKSEKKSWYRSHDKARGTAARRAIAKANALVIL